jgi:hypothetical protein
LLQLSEQSVEFGIGPRWRVRTSAASGKRQGSGEGENKAAHNEMNRIHLT